MTKLVKIEGFDKSTTTDEVMALLDNYGSIEVIKFRKPNTNIFYVYFKVTYYAFMAVYHFNNIIISGETIRF